MKQGSAHRVHVVILESGYSAQLRLLEDPSAELQACHTKAQCISPATDQKHRFKRELPKIVPRNARRRGCFRVGLRDKVHDFSWKLLRQFDYSDPLNATLPKES